MSESINSSVVVGIDGTAQSLRALRWALREAAARGLPAEVVHCWQRHTLTDVAFASAHEFERGSICMVQNEVAAALAEMPEHPQVIETSRHGAPAVILVERAAHASVLVLGAHGRTALRDVVFGQIVTNCLKHSACPVVVVDRDDNAVTYTSRVKVPSAA